MAKKISVYANEITAANFASRYGKDESKLEAWQRLCRKVGVLEGSSVNQCKKNMQGIYINIVDFVSDDYEIYPTAQALREYIKSSGKIFRLHVAKDNHLLKALLINVFKKRV